MTTYKFHPYIDDYLNAIENGDFPANKDIKKMVKWVRFKLNRPGVVIDHEKIEKAVDLMHRYFPYKLLHWELFKIACIHCYEPDGSVVFDEFFTLMGRGNGKNGFISPTAFYLTSPLHGIKGYNVEIVANSEEQAKTSFQDVYDMMDEKKNHKAKKHYYRSKEIIIGRKTNSHIKFYTSNAKTKDSLRSGCLIFDELHAYENYDSIKVFTSGLGKKKHPRTFIITTNGNVRGGPLDDYLDEAEQVLNMEMPNSGMLPMLFRLDDEKEVHQRDMWEKANPSIRFMKDLENEIEKQYTKMLTRPQMALEFMTKRMNLPVQDSYAAVTTWDKIVAATKHPFDLKEFKGMQCIGAVDYAEVNDFCSVGLLFKKNGKRYWLEHTFINHKALKVENRKINYDVDTAVKKGLVTIVKDESIKPSYIADWFVEQAKSFQIVNIAADNYRASILQEEFTARGLPLRIVRSGPPTHAKVAPLIDMMFANEEIAFGDNSNMRWYTNNVYVEIDKKGNKAFYKIEPKTRKTDGFFALIHALVIDDEIKEVKPMQFYKTYTY
ncbi:terminase TerL endonuclease subunit [Jeotgalibacillus haloalkalitolerans]|uniref:Terminase TerL endonuclease subunit n=1 Tax=Jeotgalibacillus haloalkalitolerans TaxID=3104292 RepID=A0ABU5KLZ0_9BACL|nr:terminase TerL endonuclease subunit [Jeotgalibacillus sp. HH7-29]MDZ5712248.1 terminase TerL endonuclease subunit [Jeotgalibacillus sp. HH7-29]